MIIGLPKEIKDGERRVALTPAAIASLVATGNSVRVESGAGAGCGYADGDYIAAGAVMVDSAAKAFDAGCDEKEVPLKLSWSHGPK